MILFQGEQDLAWQTAFAYAALKRKVKLFKTKGVWHVTQN